MKEPLNILREAKSEWTSLQLRRDKTYGYVVYFKADPDYVMSTDLGRPTTSLSQAYGFFDQAMSRNAKNYGINHPYRLNEI